MNNLRPVTEFIVIPPAGTADAVFAARHRMTAYLMTLFPDLTFRLQDNFPMFEGDAFSIHPIMGRAGGGNEPPGTTYLCHPPRPGQVAEIRRACEAFMAGSQRLS